jgi:hypothetical protein
MTDNQLVQWFTRHGMDAMVIREAIAIVRIMAERTDVQATLREARDVLDVYRSL